MTTSALETATATKVECDDDSIKLTLSDGRNLSVPIIWFPRLTKASALERADYELIGNGEGIHWPQLDEDISVAGLLAGKPSLEFG